MNAEVNVPQAAAPSVQATPTTFTREAAMVKETKGTFKFDEDVQNDMAVFRSLYVEKWTQVRNHRRIRVTIELL